MASDSTHVRFVDTCGRLPTTWGRSVAFFANLLALFYGNEEETQSLKNVVGEIDSYGGRLIPILNLLYRGERNLLVLERGPDEALCRYLREDLNISLPEVRVLLHRDYERIRGLLADSEHDQLRDVFSDIDLRDVDCIDGYVTDDTLAEIAAFFNRDTVTTIAASRLGNNKLLLHQYLAGVGMPTFDTQLADSASSLAKCAAALAEEGYASAVVRSQIGASGIGMLRVHDLTSTEELPDVPDYFFYEGPCLVQGWLEPGVLGVTRVRSPSTQLFVDNDTVSAFDVTEQILSDDSIHQGNESPPPYFGQFPGLYDETIRQAREAGLWLHGTGYRGTASIDWLVVEREGQATPDVYVCEINARVTGATYPSLLARHLCPDGAWLLKNLRLRTPVTTEQLLEMFEQPGHLFHPRSKAGIVPLNLNFGRDNLVHKGQFLCIGETTEQCHHFLHLAETDLPVEWDHDRD